MSEAAVITLSDRFTEQELQRVLVAPGQWRPLPPATQRSAWDALDDQSRAALIAAGEAAADEPWPALPVTLMLDFVRTGDRETYQRPERQRRAILSRLVLAECAEGQGRFIERIADALWATCEESTWCWPAHLGLQSAGHGLPDPVEHAVDLGVGETAALVAWTDYLLREALDGVHPMLHRRVEHEIERRILEPCRRRDDFWWMGYRVKRVNNWCPWVVSNWLACALLLESDAGRRAASVHKALRSLDKFIDTYHDDGGCDEGPNYWGRAGGSLFDCLDILHSATGGAVDIFDVPRILNMARFIHRAHLSGDWYVNFADAPACVHPVPGLVYRFGRAVGDEPTMAFGAWLWQRQRQRAAPSPQESIWRTLRTLFDGEGIDRAEAAPPLVRDAWLDGIEVMVARDRAGSDAGLTLAAKGGHNQESHNHNDVGQFIVYVDGRPALVDAGVGTYTRTTFDKDRYTLWMMQSQYHAVPTIELADGTRVQQPPGRAFAARDATHRADDRRASLTLDLAGAYPPEARLAHWRRTVTLHRGEAVELHEDYAFTEPVAAVTLSLLTPSEVDTGVAGALAALRSVDLGNGCASGAMRLTCDGAAPAVSVETIALDDPKLTRIWGETLYQLVLRWAEPAMAGTWTLRFEPA